MYTVTPHFDILDFVKKAKELGVDERVAELQARQFEQTIDMVSQIAQKELKTNEIASKKDIDLAIAKLKFDLIKWILATGFSSVILLSGVTFTLLKLVSH